MLYGEGNNDTSHFPNNFSGKKPLYQNEKNKDSHSSRDACRRVAYLHLLHRIVRTDQQGVELEQVDRQQIRQLVFFAFWILPVYEVTALADILVVNSIEFWSGNNPLTASTKAVDTEQGRYLIDCDGKGYTITFEPTGQKTRLNFIEETQTWAFENAEGENVPFMTFIDDSHVKMIGADGEMRMVELSQRGLMAYQAECSQAMMAQR